MDLSEEMIEELCASNPHIKRAEQGIIIEKEGASFHIFGTHSPEDIEVVGQEGSWYLPFCSRDEVVRLLNPQSNEDALLKMRAEAMVDSPRLVRVFRKRRRGKSNWTLTGYYNSFCSTKRYLSNLSKGNRERLENLPAGSAYLEEANAMCMKTDWGNVIAVSEPLQHFLYFMNIFYFGEKLGVPDIDQFHAFLIALRIMGGFESYDFDLDPRGDIHYTVDMFLKPLCALQHDFILGHEYAHHLLGHLSDSALVNFRLNSKAQTTVTGYRYNHKKEFDADHYAIKNIRGNNNYKGALTDAAFQVLIYFHVVELVKDYIAPQIHQGSHPSPEKRIKKLRKKINREFGRSSDCLEKQLKSMADFTNKFLTEWLAFNIEEFEQDGSFYLPSYKKKMLIDRLDF